MQWLAEQQSAAESGRLAMAMTDCSLPTAFKRNRNIKAHVQ